MTKRNSAADVQSSEVAFNERWAGILYSAFRPTGRKFISPSGDKFEDELGYVVRQDGRKEVDVVGKRDVYTMKQEALSSVYLRDLVSKYDRGMLSQAEFDSLVKSDMGLEFDATNKPSSLRDLLQSQIDAEDLFYSLPPDLRGRFGSSKAAFYSSIMDGSVFKVFDEYRQSAYGPKGSVGSSEGSVGSSEGSDKGGK